LPGFTIKRGVGQGGFGEVYFAVSDAGKEVALKMLRGGSEIELRGTANCLNLKHPNLVHVYDLKTDSHGDHWLVMEYVLGESLAHVLERHPDGLPREIAVEWFRSLCKAVGYLHDMGVVHRDLKPGNIFLEHGNLKVGDYGLCKSMNASQRPQTRQVGTVEYMAPEISTGQYTKSIDIYACGIILFEMLTGRRPFAGETDAEILMKQLTATADLSPLPAEFREVVGKALEKTPARRYASMAEFLRALEAVAVNKPLPVSPPPPVPVVVLKPASVPAPKPTTGPPPMAVRDRLLELSEAMTIAAVMLGVAAVVWAGVGGFIADWAPLGKGFLTALAVTWAALLVMGQSSAKPSDAWPYRFRMALCGAAVGYFVHWLDGWPGFAATSPDPDRVENYFFDAVQVAPGTLPVLAQYMLYFTATVGLIGWWKIAAKNRKESFSVFPIITAGLWGGMLGFLWPRQEAAALQFGVVPLMLAAGAVQWVSPWTPPPPPMPRRLRWRG
jgi:hypothetical protein